VSYEIRPEDHDRFAILTDTTLCTGCESCVHACKQEYGLGRDRAWRWRRKIDDLSSTRFCTIIRQPGNRFIRQQCRHCDEPACVSACIVGALQKQETGAVTYDEDRCMGCRYCMMACPFGVPRYSWENTVPLVTKCIMCQPRLEKGQQPACTEACPYGATIFGSRAEMIEEANKRFAASPDKYYTRPGDDQPHLHGYHEVGGVSVLYLSDISLDFYPFVWRPEMGDEALPTLTWAALSKVPPIVVGMAAAMSGVYWVVGRRMKLQAEAQAQAQGLPIVDPANDPPSDKG
jgi:formate dehydrogenase iron-sulfur subunit